MRKIKTLAVGPVAGQSEAGEPGQGGTFVDKLAVAEIAGMKSTRWVDNQLALGLPHLRMGPRRVRFDKAEVTAWLRQKYAARRIGPAGYGAK